LTVASGAPGAPKMTRGAAAAIDGRDPQPSVEAGVQRVDVVAEPAQRSLRPRRRRECRRAGQAAGGLEARERQRRQWADDDRAGAQRGTRDADSLRAVARGGRAPRARGPIAGLEPVAGRQRGGDDRSRGRPEHVLAVA
jgi:hypothetical protein